MEQNPINEYFDEACYMIGLGANQMFTEGKSYEEIAETLRCLSIAIRNFSFEIKQDGSLVT